MITISNIFAIFLADSSRQWWFLKKGNELQNLGKPVSDCFIFFLERLLSLSEDCWDNCLFFWSNQWKSEEWMMNTECWKENGFVTFFHSGRHSYFCYWADSFINCQMEGKRNCDILLIVTPAIIPIFHIFAIRGILFSLSKNQWFLGETAMWWPFSHGSLHSNCSNFFYFVQRSGYPIALWLCFVPSMLLVKIWEMSFYFHFSQRE